MSKPTSAGKASDKGSRREEAGEQGRVFPPDSPVDVPNLPPAPTASTPDEARDASQPEEETRGDGSWADNTKPAPYKKHVRDSNIF
ncbi:hypothetical protein CAL12_09420 [Bordetella genomosp. 8]|uniref:Uncharacterized protein n=1 Tax=Bordetella genomosp. 8 TaxID=1416806 RepID=A0A1W6YJ12_9BORD|nr:hypothetical protein [Bordetella genomosp. 8]ARP81042.1 hypothetical protein CAL12_09420 [Bordetella genomosp. 8]